MSVRSEASDDRAYGAASVIGRRPGAIPTAFGMAHPHPALGRLGWFSLGLALLILVVPGPIGNRLPNAGYVTPEVHAGVGRVVPAAVQHFLPTPGLVRPTAISVNRTLVLASNQLLPGNAIPASGNHPVYPFYDPLTSLVYISDTSAGNLLTLDPQNDTYRTPFHIGGSPDAISLDPLNQLLYVTNLLGNTVSVVNATSGAVVAKVTVGLAPSGVIFDPTNGAMLVTDQNSNQISIINATSNRFLANETGWNGPYGIAYDAADGHVYVTDHLDPSNSDALNCTGTVSVYNATGSLAFLHNVTVGNDPNGIAYDPANQELYVADGNGCGLTAIDGRNDTSIGYFPPGPGIQFGTSQPWGVTIDARTDHVFVTGVQYFRGLRGTVVMINGSNNEVSAQVNVDGQVRWMADDPTTGRVYAADDRAMDVMVVDAQSGALVGDDLTGSLPGAMVFDPVNHQVYVTDPNAAVVLAVNTTTDTVVRKINAGPGAAGLAVDPRSGNVVVALTLEGELVQVNASTDRPRWFATEQDWGIGGNYPTAELFTASGQLLDADNSGSCPTGTEGNVGEEQVPTPNSCIDVRSPSSGSLERVLHIWGGPDGTSLAGNPITQAYYFPVTNNNGTAMNVLNDSTLTWSRQVLVGTNDQGRYSSSGAGNDSILYDLSTNRIYFGNCGGNRVTVLNATTFAFLGNVSVPNPTALAYDNNDGLVFAASQNGSVAVINGTTNALVGSIRVGANPDGLAYDPISDQLFVANNASGTVSILNMSLGARPPSPMATLSVNTTVVRAGVPVTFTVNLTGGPAGVHYEYGLPPGCASMDTAALVCTPTVPGTYWVTAGVYDPWGRSWTPNAVVLTVTRWLYPVVFTETGLPAGTPWGITATFGLENSTSPFIRVLLPNSTGVGFYVTSVAGYSSSPVGQQVFDVSGVGLSIPIRFLPIPGPLSVVSFTAAPTSYRVGSALTLTVLAHGGAPPYRFAYSNLPPGCASANSSTLACTPAVAGDYPLLVVVSDSSGQSASGTLSLLIAPSAVSRTSPSGPLGGFLGLPPLEQFVLLGTVAAVGLGLAAVLVPRARRRHPPAPGGSTPSRIRSS